MKPVEVVAKTPTPDGNELILYRHDKDYWMSVNREELMSSRRHFSELELARLGCARIAHRRAPRVLIGGLGFGYTLRAALDMLQPNATVVVAELLPDVIRWNRDIIGELAGRPLSDRRVEVISRDVLDVLKESPGAYDAILLDIDNGTTAVTAVDNDRLYSRDGIRTILSALHTKGCFAVWAASYEHRFKHHLQSLGLEVNYFRSATWPGGRSRPHCIWMASRDKRSLPPLENILPSRKRSAS